MDQALKTTRKLISPKFRTGSVADFKIEKFQGFIGYIFLKHNGKSRNADFAEFKLMDQQDIFETTVGRGGEFYFENLPYGNYRAQVKLEGDLCIFQMKIPKTQDMIVELGEFTCEM